MLLGHFTLCSVRVLRNLRGPTWPQDLPSADSSAQALPAGASEWLTLPFRLLKETFVHDHFIQNPTFSLSFSPT